MHRIILEKWGTILLKWWSNFWSIEKITIWWVLKIFFRTHTLWWKNFSENKNSSRGDLVNKVNMSKYDFWRFSEKLVGDKKYLILRPQKSFGKSFDHFNHSENNLHPYSHQQTFFSHNWNFEVGNFYFWIYVIFMKFFWGQ